MLSEDAKPSPMSPDTNHNEIIDNKQNMFIKVNGIHKEAAVPENMLNNKGLILCNSNKVPTTGGTAEEVPNEDISTRTAVGEQQIIQEFFHRNEPIGRPENGKSFFFKYIIFNLKKLIKKMNNIYLLK